MSFDSSRSANSGRSKSKHSLDSNSSNSKKKQKSNQIQNQKTLGMAWGSNSLSSSKSSSRKANFPDFGSYMVVKNKKLQDQFDSEASNSSLNGSSNSGSKPLFHGVSIFVDGFTVPSSQELRSYMLKYGGRFENYFSRTRVTHIICSNLPDSKIKNIRSFSRGLPVVKPTWVLDCVAANKLLNWVPYQLDQLTNDVRKQPKLSSFFVSKTNSRLEDAKTQVISDANSVDGSLEMVATSQEAPSCEVGETIEHSAEPIEEITVSDQDKFFELSKEEPTNVEEHISDSKIPESTSFDLNIGEAFRSSPCKSSASANDYLPDRNDKISSPRNAPSSNQHHSTSGDPDFVQNYFKNSRLHFIGTWRNRYPKRFPSLPDGSKVGNAAANTSTLSHRTAVIHVDMDCFFVSVIIRNLPELQDKPVAVCHSDNPRGTAEISSANYPARDFGVRAGMFVRDAKALCPHLVILPYNFEAYEVVADQFYQILHKHSKKVQAVSCDEAFLDVTDREDEHAEHIASLIRKEIYEATGCTASAGIAENVLMARLATRTAKPNGQYLISPEKVESFLDELPIKALPGIGHVLEEKLKRLQIQTCGELRMIPKESLQRDFGSKTGNMLWNYSRGIDNRPVGVVQETKSVGADVNWGVRFSNLHDSQKFIVKLCNEVSLRLQGCGVQGRTVTMKLKKKKKDAGKPVKYMGCGDCENLSHSMTIPVATDDVDVLQRISKQLFGHFHIDVKEIRGIGLHVTRLENADAASQGHERNVLRSWLSSASENKEPIHSPRETTSGDSAKLGKLKCDGSPSKFPQNVSGPSFQGHTDQSASESSLFQVSSLPHICDLDMGVIESLPPEILSEVNEMYGGKLTNILVKNKGKDYNISDLGNDSSRREVKGERTKGKEPLLSGQTIVEKTRTRNKGDKSRLEEDQSASTSVCEDKTELVPTSLSQVDISILQELPEELKVDILDQLPAHRNLENKCTEDESVSKNGLWNGNPPEWVGKFEVSNHLILNLLADMYYKTGSTGLLSSILQSIISLLPVISDASDDGSEDMISNMCGFLEQYIDVKIKSDMEELYICFRLLRRFTVKSRFFLQVFDRVLPYLQASFGEIYGGNMNV